jgi:hypothetical protein
MRHRRTRGRLVFDRRLPNPLLVGYVFYRLDRDMFFGPAGALTFGEWVDARWVTA